MKTAFWASLILTSIGALNWALYAATGIDAVAAIFGAFTIESRIVYTLVGFAALALIAISSTNVAIISPVEKSARTARTTRLVRRSNKSTAKAA